MEFYVFCLLVACIPTGFFALLWWAIWNDLWTALQNSDPSEWFR